MGTLLDDAQQMSDDVLTQLDAPDRDLTEMENEELRRASWSTCRFLCQGLAEMLRECGSPVGQEAGERPGIAAKLLGELAEAVEHDADGALQVIGKTLKFCQDCVHHDRCNCRDYELALMAELRWQKSAAPGRGDDLKSERP